MTRPEIVIHPIGVIRTPHNDPTGAPIQPLYADEAEGKVIVEQHVEPALADIEEFELVWLIYWFDRASAFKFRVVPYRDTREHGLFATRAPCRPNPIGMSAVRVLGREQRTLRVSCIDVLDGTPLIDIKPYVPAFDAHSSSRAGWFDESLENRQFADGRFHHG